MTNLEALPDSYIGSDAYYRDMYGEMAIPDGVNTQEYTGPLTSRQFGDYIVEMNTSHHD